MKILRNILLGLVGLVLLAILGLWVTGNGFILTGITRTYMVGHPTANIDDSEVFKTREITAGTPQEWPLADTYSTTLLPQEFLDDIEANDAVAFLVAKDGQLVTEHYFAAYNDRSKTNSFSMAKTVVTMLLGKAIEDGYVEGLDQKITDFLPNFKDDQFGKDATLGSLSSMSSGYDWNEDYYSPFSPTVELYYGNNVEDFVCNRPFSKEVDTYFYYSSASTQMLSIILSKAIKKNNPDLTLSAYLSENFWQPLGMNDDALWHLDNNGQELGYCCINTNARNFAKLGQLLLQHGNWQGEQLLDSTYIAMMHTPQFVANYGYSTWIGTDGGEPFYYFRGHLGQYILVVPNQNMVIVRLGKTRGTEVSVEQTLAEYVQQAMAII